MIKIFKNKVNKTSYTYSMTIIEVFKITSRFSLIHIDENLNQFKQQQLQHQQQQQQENQHEFIILLNNLPYRVFIALVFYLKNYKKFRNNFNLINDDLNKFQINTKILKLNQTKLNNSSSLSYCCCCILLVSNLYNYDVIISSW